jgi:hypothetical protein
MLLEPVEFVNQERTFVGVSTYQLRKGEDIGRFPSKGNLNGEQNASIAQEATTCRARSGETGGRQPD